MFDLFRNPPAQYSVVPLWIWNARIDDAEIKRQIREMHQKGIGGFVIQAPPGNHDKKAEKRHVEHARKAARELGMHAYTVDELPALAIPDRSGSSADVKDYALLLDTLAHADPVGETVNLDLAEEHAAQVMAVKPDQPGSDLRVHRLKLGSSLAHTHGIGRVMTGLFGDCGWSLSLERMKAIIDREAVLGANMFSPRAFLSTLAGTRVTNPPASQFYQTTFWSHYKMFADYASRLCYALSQGKHRAQAALFYPIKAFQYEQANLPDGPVARMISDYFDIYHTYLPKEHVDFDVLDEDAVRRAMSLDERLMLQGEEYELLVMPPTTAIGYETALKLKEFVEDGGKLLATMLLPLRDADGERHEEVAEIFQGMFGINPRELRDEVLSRELPTRPRLSHNAGNLLFYQAGNPADLVPGLRGTLSMAIKPEISIRRGGSECHDITCVHRTLDDKEIYFLANNAAEAREVRISIRCDRAPYVLNLETGESAALANCTQQGSRTVLLHRFEKYGSLLVYFTNELALTAIPQSLENGYEIVLPDEWDFKLEGDNCLTLHEWTINILGQPEATQYEYTTTFDTAGAPGRLLLILDDGCTAEGRAVYINDVQANEEQDWSPDHGFKAIDISMLVKHGTNRVKIVVVSRGESGPPLALVRQTRIAGAFSLDATRTIIKSPRKTMRTGSWTEHGYPYYSGTATYSQLVDIPEFFRGQRVFVRAENPADMVEFVINGAAAGIRPWPPYEMDVTALVKPGRNTIELKITNSLANALTRESRPSGLIEGARVIIY